MAATSNPVGVVLFVTEFEPVDIVRSWVAVCDTLGAPLGGSRTVTVFYLQPSIVEIEFPTM